MSFVQTRIPIAISRTGLSLMKGGNGKPLLILHGGGGHPGWMPYHEALAKQFTVYAPSHPGFDTSDRPDWLTTVMDIAYFYLSYLDQEDITDVNLLGFSLGGWIAAEMVAMCPHIFEKLVLVDAAGIKPEVGEIAETMMISADEVQKLMFYDTDRIIGYQEKVNLALTSEEQIVQWNNREMFSRLGWRPYLHNPKLPSYLGRVKLPTLIIWGRQDAIIPLNSADLYHKMLVNSTLHVIDDCGHLPHIERPDQFLTTVLRFLSTT
ncbi:alpha/beta hydrolase [SAR202 cluster bacterium AD-804-J14_MRT_500m]|nr:alpha/beta hydrolase [SAR202 cluster bacterium AD-804-J14_MRT_500m]